MENKEKVAETLVRHGYVRDLDGLEEALEKSAQARRVIEDHEETQMIILTALSKSQEWGLYTMYATSLALEKGDQVPYAWSAMAYGTRKAGLLEEAKKIAVIGLELCPTAPETLLEVCRCLCLEGNFELANRYRDIVVADSKILAKAIATDRDFRGLRKWRRRSK